TVATFAALALDFGFTTGTTATNSTSIIVVDNSLFRPGQWIVVGGAGNTTASRSLVTQVQSTAGSTQIFVSPAAATTLLNVPIGQANLYGATLLPPATQFGPSAAVANAHAFGGAMEAGLAKVYNPKEMCTRSLAFTGATAIAVAYSAVISGWDVWGNAMTEVVSAAATVTTFASRKAFNYISSITSGTTVPSSQTVAFGLSDVVGLPMRCDYWEELYVTWNGAAMANSNGFSPGIVGTTVQNSTTDVRGTLALSTAIITGGLTTAISAIATNG